jgi:hypothetical protein
MFFAGRIDLFLKFKISFVEPVKCITLLVLLIVLIPLVSLRAENSLSSEEPPGEWSKEKKAWVTNIATGAGIITYGVFFWDYGQRSPAFKSEGWFSENTKYGGADKAGHSFSSYLTADLFSGLYRQWGYEEPAAVRLGSVSSFSIMTLMEVGDSFSSYGFSYEDFLANTSGAALSYLLGQNKSLSRKIDFRVEYLPSKSMRNGNVDDLLTDYTGMKHLLALKINGFEAAQNNLLKYLELQFGFYTRGYLGSDLKYYDEKSQDLYVGIGLNMIEILKRLSFKNTSRAFHYYQMPSTYLPYKWKRESRIRSEEKL